MISNVFINKIYFSLIFMFRGLYTESVETHRYTMKNPDINDSFKQLKSRKRNDSNADRKSIRNQMPLKTDLNTRLFGKIRIILSVQF